MILSIAPTSMKIIMIIMMTELMDRLDIHACRLSVNTFIFLSSSIHFASYRSGTQLAEFRARSQTIFWLDAG